MTTQPASMILLLGERHPEYGTYAAHRLTSRTSVALSAGAGGETPALRAKGDPNVPNEDALLAADDGERVLLAVADGHWGHEASHGVLQWLADGLSDLGELPGDGAVLAGALRGLAGRRAEPPYRARSTFLIAVFDRGTGHGCGLSFGDSSFAVATPGGAVVPQNARSRRYVSPAEPATLAPEDGSPFAFEARPGDLLLAYTDGIDECHYGRPETSVTPAVMATLLDDTGSDPARFTERLVTTALAGVGGHPGGQDNIALVVSRA